MTFFVFFFQILYCRILQFKLNNVDYAVFLDCYSNYAYNSEFDITIVRIRKIIEITLTDIYNIIISYCNITYLLETNK